MAPPSESERHRVRDSVEDAIGDAINAEDPQDILRGGDFQDVLDDVLDQTMKAMEEDKRSALDDEDQSFISRRVRSMVSTYHKQYRVERSKPTRFLRTERVICLLADDRWASGAVMAVNEDYPDDPTGPTLPYVVKLDDPRRLISVPNDDHDTVRSEVCFGQRAGALWFSLFSMPKKPATAKLRFSLGERVACAVEDDSDDYSVWTAGTVIDVGYSVKEDAKALIPDRDWEGDAASVPYRVALDSGCKVLVHRDEHWLVRDLELQLPGTRQSAKGTRSLTRIERRHRGDYTFEAVDHMTRQVRSCDPPASDDEEEHGEDCDCC